MIFIPPLGTRLVLAAPWTFTLHREYRNDAVMKALVPISVAVVKREIDKVELEKYRELYRQERRNFKELGPAPTAKIWDYAAKRYVDAEMVNVSWEVDLHPDTAEITLAAGTVLVVDRIYVRKGAGEFDSVTFNIAWSPDPRLMPKSKKGFLKGQARFWAKLADVNRAYMEPEGKPHASAPEPMRELHGY